MRAQPTPQQPTAQPGVFPPQALAQSGAFPQMNANQNPPAETYVQTAPANSAALRQILEQADDVFPASSAMEPGYAAVSAPMRTRAQWDREVDELLQEDLMGDNPAPSGDGSVRTNVDNPFPGQFPGSTWVRVERPA